MKGAAVKTYSLSMIGISVFAIFIALIVLYENVRESADPEFGLSSVQYRKSIDFNYFVHRLNSDSESGKKSDDTSPKLDDATLKKRWEDYKIYSLQTVKRNAQKGLSSILVSLALLAAILVGHIVLYRKSRTKPVL